MNWGVKITIAIVLYIFIMLGMLYVATNQTNDMIDSNYYDKEIKYQELIDASNNLKGIAGADSIIVEDADRLVITLPKDLKDNFKNGDVELINNSAKEGDLLLKLTPDANGKFYIQR
nr:FixH family protein [Saprospiraceae bacterium]